MASTSRIPVVKAAIVELLEEAFSGQDVQVSYGHPGRDVQTEFVFVGDNADWDTEWASLGAQSRREKFALQLVVNALGSTQQEATERMFYLFSIAENTLTDPANHTLDSALVMAMSVAGATFDEYIAQSGRGAAATGAIRCEARLTSGD